MAHFHTLNALSGGENEYSLNPDWAGCWIDIEGLRVYIARQPSGVQVEIYQPHGQPIAVAEARLKPEPVAV